MDWSEWVTQKYLEFRGDAVGRERTITDYASYLGVSQPRLTQMMKKGSKPPTSYSIINAFVTKYGEEAFQALGMPAPNSADYVSIEPMTREEALVEILRLADQYGYQVEIYEDGKRKITHKRE